MRLMYGGDLLAKSLAQEGVDHFIGVTGGQMLSLFDAVEKDEQLKLVVPRNEAAGAMIADGFTRASGRVAAVMSTVGAGIVYSIAGTANAWGDHVPIFSISPQVQSWKMYPQQESLQGCYQADMVAGATRWNCTVYNWKRIPRMVQRALREALSGERGPVHMDIPVDVFFDFQPVTEGRFRRLAAAPGSSRFEGSFLPGDAARREALNVLKGSSRPLIVAGLSVHRERSWEALASLAEAVAAPVVVTSAALTALKADHPSYIGVLGHQAMGNAPRAFEQADALLMIGTTLGEGEEIIDMVDRGSTQVIQTSPEPELLGALGPVAAAMAGDSESICRIMTDGAAGDQAARDKWRKACRDDFDKALAVLREEAGASATGAAVKAFGETINKDGLVVLDGRDSVYWGSMLCPAGDNNSLFLSRGLKGNGYGLPMALGVKLAFPGRKVYALCDTTALLHHVQELDTARREGIAVTVCVVGEPLSWTGIAGGLGAKAFEARSRAQLQDAIKNGNTAGATVIDLTGYK